MANAKSRYVPVSRIFLALLLAALLAFSPFLAGCDEQEQEQEQEQPKTHVTVSVWDGSVISSGFADYIDSVNPSYDIEWIVGEDSLDFYEYQAENGSLPDVILAKDFNEVSAKGLTESLYALDDTALVSEGNGEYLRSYPCNEEAVYYAVGAAGFEGILVNEYLFDLYDIPVPTDRASFLEACQRFSELGIRGFVAGMGDAQTCYEVLQGFAEDSLVSQTEDLFAQILSLGTAQNVSLDAAAFDDALSFVGELSDQKVIQASDMGLSAADAEAQFVAGSAAMLFISDGQASSFGEEHNMTVRAIPFFGTSSSWAFVEPSFIGMVSNVHTEGVKATASDEEIHADAIEVLSSIMSEGAQEYYLSLYGIDEVVSPAGDEVALSDALTTLEPCLAESRVRVFVPNDAIAQAVGATMQKVGSGTTSTEDALTEVRAALEEGQAQEKTVAASFAEGVSNLFDEERGNVAASDIAQVATAALSVDFMITTPNAARCPLYAGDKKETELAYPVAEMNVYTASLTGERIEELLAASVAQVHRASDLPVASGLHMVVSQGEEGYSLSALSQIQDSGTAQEGASNTTTTNEGRAETSGLDVQEIYTVAIACYDWEGLAALAQEYGFALQDGTLQDVWLSAYENGTVKGLPSYQDYFAFA